MSFIYCHRSAKLLLVPRTRVIRVREAARPTPDRAAPCCSSLLATRTSKGQDDRLTRSLQIPYSMTPIQTSSLRLSNTLGTTTPGTWRG